MTDTQIEFIFSCQTKNVHELERSWKYISRSINDAFVNNQDATAHSNTKLLIIIFCAWSEASFSKLLHTPDSFSGAEILEVKKATANGISNAWRKCLELALSRLNSGPHSTRKPNIKLKLERIIDKYVFDPSLLRNKLAHGQWVVALNGDHTNENSELSKKIEAYNIVDLQILKTAYSSLYLLMTMLVQSPNKGFNNTYEIELQKMEARLEKMGAWTLQQKISLLKKKKNHSRKSN